MGNDNREWAELERWRRLEAENLRLREELRNVTEANERNSAELHMVNRVAEEHFSTALDGFRAMQDMQQEDYAHSPAMARAVSEEPDFAAWGRRLVAESGMAGAPPLSAVLASELRRAYRQGQREAHLYEDEARAKLIAQAPAMARLLLKLEWPAEDEGANERCFICDRGPFKRPDLKKPREPDGHAPDCEWVAVLRSAGVLP